jgi:hypothetical protein
MWKIPEKVPRLSIESRNNLSRNSSSASHFIIRNKLSKVCGTVVYGGLGVDHNFCLAGISVLHPPARRKPSAKTRYLRSDPRSSTVPRGEAAGKFSVVDSKDNACSDKQHFFHSLSLDNPTRLHCLLLSRHSAPMPNCRVFVILRA